MVAHSALRGSAFLGFLTLLACSTSASAIDLEWWLPPVCPAKSGKACPDKAWLEQCLSDNLDIGVANNGKRTVTLMNNNCFLNAGVGATEAAQILRRLQTDNEEPVVGSVSFISVSKGCR